MDKQIYWPTDFPSTDPRRGPHIYNVPGKQKVVYRQDFLGSGPGLGIFYYLGSWVKEKRHYDCVAITDKPTIDKIRDWISANG